MRVEAATSIGGDGRWRGPEVAFWGWREGQRSVGGWQSLEKVARGKVEVAEIGRVWGLIGGVTHCPHKLSEVSVLHDRRIPKVSGGGAL